MNMMVPISIFIIYLLIQVEARSVAEIKTASQRVRQYLFKSRSTQLEEKTWLENSAKIGAGYHTMTGSPVCYSG